MGRQRVREAADAFQRRMDDSKPDFVGGGHRQPGPGSGGPELYGYEERHRASRETVEPSIFIDELDKTNLSKQYAPDSLHNILDAVINYKGCVVACSNLSPKSIHGQFQDKTGSAVLRRLCQSPFAVYVDFDSQKVFVNTVEARTKKDGNQVHLSSEAAS